MSKAARGQPRALTARFGSLDVWSVAAQFVPEWGWPSSALRPLHEALVRRRDAASDTLAPSTEVTMLTIRLDGSVEPRPPVRLKDVKGRLFRAYPGDVVFSKIDVRNGAVGLAPVGVKPICVTSEFPVYAVKECVAVPEYVQLLFRTATFRRILNSMISGASGRKRIQPTQLEKVRVPIPSTPVQRHIASLWLDANRQLAAAEADFVELVAELDGYLRERTRDFESSTQARTFVARFKDTRQWDLKGGRAAAFIAANTDFVRLGDCSEECTHPVRPWKKPDKSWPVYGVNNRDGVFLSATKEGKHFKAPYKRIEKNWFFHNPTRANVGSLGIVDDVPHDAITSPEYEVWRLTGGFLTGFMALLLWTDYFLALVSINRVGAVKQRMYYRNLAEIRLPNVPMSMQQSFADRRARMLREINTSRRMVSERTTEVEEMIIGSRSPELH
ncbi:MAG: hypothetical protein F4Y16_09150 [Holophagales bacterium]|nr:hypothetical protein [Holophagales bacterium]MYH24286.1 hypothetical protein [Holophagales bacterium]